MVHAREGWFANIEVQGERLRQNRHRRGHRRLGRGDRASGDERDAGRHRARRVELFGRIIMGKDPFQIGAIHAALDHLFLQGNAGARSAIDIALYDIMGKAAGQPIYNLLGGAFQTTFGLARDHAARRAEAMAEHALKLLERATPASSRR